MSETNNTHFSSSENRSNSKRKKFATFATILVSLMGAPEESRATNRTTQNFTIELGQALGENDEKIRDKEQMTTDYISRNLYINGKSAQDLNATVKMISQNLYSVEFEQEFLEGPRKINMVFETKYENNGIFMNFQGYKISTEKGMRDFPTNNFFEIDKTTHNKYDVRTVGNGKRENFNIVYNDYKTKEAIKNIIKAKEISPKKGFDYIPEFENTQLTKLNTPTLGKEVFNDGDEYYRTLFYSTGKRKIDITNIYFKTNGELNLEKTQRQGTIKLMGIDVKYSINENLEFSIDDTSKQALIEKVRHDREVLINALNIEDRLIADNDIFSGLNKEETTSTHQFNTKIVLYGLDPVSGIYDINLNKDNQLEHVYCKINGDNIQLVDETGKTLDKTYLNYYKNTKDKKNTNYYKITVVSNGFDIGKVAKPIENPKEILPDFNGDKKAVNLLKDRSNLTNNKSNSLEFTDQAGNLKSNIPCHRLEDGNYEINEEYSTKIDIMDLYNYSGYKTITQQIENLTAELGIVDACTMDIFKKCLQNEGVEFDQKLVKITDPNSGESVYYNLNQNFKIEKDETLYKKVEKCLKLMQTRLELAKKINNSHIWRKNGKEYKDFEKFIGGESGIGKEIISPEQLNKFISGESDEITIKISRGKGAYTDIVYRASGDTLSTRLKSGEGKGIVRIGNHEFTIKTKDKSGDIVVDPKEEKE